MGLWCASQSALVFFFLKKWHQYLKGFLFLHRRRSEPWSSAAHSDAFESLKIYFPFRLTAVWDYNRALQEEDGEGKPSLKEPGILQDASLCLTSCKSNWKEGEERKKRSSKLYAVGQKPQRLKSIYICKEIYIFYSIFFPLVCVFAVIFKSKQFPAASWVQCDWWCAGIILLEENTTAAKYSSAPLSLFVSGEKGWKINK